MEQKKHKLWPFFAIGAAVAIIIVALIIILNNKNNTIAGSLDFDSENWSYDSANDIYYQIGVNYAEKPVSADYETFGIYVPGDYLDCSQNGDKYACEVSASGEKNGYTAATAPVVMPVNTPGYSAQQAPTSYSAKTAKSYTDQGFIYLYAGCRGRISSGGPNKSKTATSVDFETGAPWGVVDLKAAVRYVRYNDAKIPGDKDAIFAFGHSGGGAQSAILGASGDSPLYEPYLEQIGAAMNYADGTKISDAIAGVNSWCPITELDVADAAYEWNMGQYSSKNTRADGVWTKDLSNDLAKVYADYINNEAAFVDENGNKLTLDETSDGIYAAGSYYDYVLGVINESLNNYLQDNYDSDSERASYVASLGSWAAYANGKATVSSIQGFVNSQKSPTKSVAAFDDLSRSQAENEVFASSDNSALHFDDRLATLIYNNDYAVDADYVSAFSSDLMNTDSLGSSQPRRLLMYTPTFFLTDIYSSKNGGHFAVDDNSATPAKYWRVRTGITQGDTALTTEINLSLALGANDKVEDVDFATVWGKGHTEAERTGSASANFISWVESLTK